MKAPRAANDVVVFTALGPNPAPLVELVWKLAEEGHRARAAHVVEVARTADYVASELLAKGGALDQLHEVAGPSVLPLGKLVRHPARTSDGTILTDDETEEHAAIYAEAIWGAARKAQLDAKENPVVFALAGGRRRTATALVSTTFQLLGRPQDVCRDVRLNLREAEGATGFYFPTQRCQNLRSRDRDQRPFRAADVQIAIPIVRLPKLRPLLREADLQSYAVAFAASEERIGEAAPPRLHIDFASRTATVDGHALAIAESWFLWLGALALARREGDGWLDSDDERIRELWKRGPKWERLVDNDGAHQSVVLQWLRGTLDPERDPSKQQDAGQPLKKLRTDIKGFLEEFCSRHPPGWSRWLIPESRKEDAKTRQRLPLPPERIEIVGLRQRRPG